MRSGTLRAEGRTSMSIRAFEVLDSSWTCFITVCLIVLESMVGLFGGGVNGQGAKRGIGLTIDKAAARDR